MENRRVLPFMKSEGEPENPGKAEHEAKKKEHLRDQREESRKTRAGDDGEDMERSLSTDDITVANLLKGRANAEELFELLKSPVIGGRKLDPGQVAGVMRGNPQQGHLSGGPAPEVKERAAKEKEEMKARGLAALKQTVKSEGEDMDIEKASWSLDFSKSILDKMGLTKAKKEKNESGEEFQDGSEDTIGAEGHAATVRPVAHEGGGTGPNNPGTKTKRASQEGGDLQKSDNLADNLPEEFEEGIEEDDTIPPEGGGAKKSLSYDDVTVAILLKSSPFAEQILESLVKAEQGRRDEEAAREHRYQAWKKRSDARAEKWKTGIEGTKRAMEHLRSKRTDLEGNEEKSEGNGDLEKGFSSSVRGTRSPTKGAAGRHFAREAAEEQKAEDVKHKIDRPSVLGSGGEVSNVSDKYIRVRPVKKSEELHAELDAILKARRPSWDPKPKHEDADKEAQHADQLSGDPGSREHEYKRKQELADKWQAKKNSPEFRAASKIKDADEDDGGDASFVASNGERRVY